MDKQIGIQNVHDLNLSKTLNSNTQSHNFNSSTSNLNFTIKRKRSLTSLNPNRTRSLQKINKTPSPKHTNKTLSSLTSSLTLKDKNHYLKPELLHQKFHQLSLNPTLKKPLKLKISKLNNQASNDLIKNFKLSNEFPNNLLQSKSQNQASNDILKQHLNHFSQQLDSKFETQNQILRNSLQKIEKFVINNAKIPQIQNQISSIVVIDSQKQINYHKIQDIASKFKSHQIKQSQVSIKQDCTSFPDTNKKLEELMEEIQKLNQKINSITENNQKLSQQTKQLKTINNFLVSENYKLSLEISFLKQKVLEFEQKEYENACINESTIEKSLKGEQKTQMEKQLSNQQLLPHTYLNLSQQKFNNQPETSQRKHQIPSTNLLIKQIQTENFSLFDKQIQNIQSFSTLHLLENPKNILHSNININETSQNYISKLYQKIQTLQNQLHEQKNDNQNLSNKLAVLKLQTHGSKNQRPKHQKQNQSLDSVVSIKINLQSQEEIQHQQSNTELLKKTALFYQSVQRSNNSQFSLQNIPHRATKSKILSNQIIYFSETLNNANQINSSFHKLKSEGNQRLIENKQIKTDDPSFLVTIKQQDEDQKKKTLCMKKLQIPAEQIRKRRKTISQQLNTSLQKKGNKNKNNNNSLSFYSKQKIAQLQMLRQTVSLKFQAFKYTYELFQSQMMLWPNRKASSKELKSILSEYPFLLEESAIDILQSYCDASDPNGIPVDIFCNKMREFISEYTEISEQQELILQKKILKRWKYTSQQILDLMKKSETVPGQITKDSFCSVLKEFKFEQNEIHHLLSQSVGISPDLNRIKYKHYLENFLAKN